MFHMTTTAAAQTLTLTLANRQTRTFTVDGRFLVGSQGAVYGLVSLPSSDLFHVVGLKLPRGHFLAEQDGQFVQVARKA